MELNKNQFNAMQSVLKELNHKRMPMTIPKELAYQSTESIY